MSKTILLGKDMLQMDIYSLNLRAFVGTEVTILNTADKVRQFLNLDNSVDIIISVNKSADEELALEVLKVVKEKKLTIPVCSIGEVSESEGIYHVFNKNLELKELVRFLAKFFDVTAKNMVTLNVGEFYPIPINYFIGLKNMTDVYTRVNLADGSYQYDKKCRKDETFDQGLLEEYMIKGLKNLYIPSLDRLKFTNFFTTQTFDRLTSDNLSAHERIGITDMAMHMTAKEIKSIGLNAHTSIMAKTCIESIEKTVKDYPKLTNLLNRLLKSPESWTYKYCQILTYVTNHMVSKTEWGSKEQVEKLNFATFFQDLEFLAYDLDAEKLIPILNNEDLVEALNSGLSEEEKEIIEKHAATASELVKDLPVTPFEVDVIIKQHHGSYNGIGFPEDIQGNISHLAQLSMVAQDFTRELMRIYTPDQFNPGKLVKKIQLKYKKQRMKKFVESLESITF